MEVGKYDKEAAKSSKHDRFCLHDYADEELAEQARLNRRLKCSAMLRQITSSESSMYSAYLSEIAFLFHCSRGRGGVFF